MWLYFSPEFNLTVIRDKNYGEICYVRASTFCTELKKAGVKRLTEVHLMGRI